MKPRQLANSAPHTVKQELERESCDPYSISVVSMVLLSANQPLSPLELFVLTNRLQLIKSKADPNRTSITLPDHGNLISGWTSPAQPKTKSVGRKFDFR